MINFTSSSLPLVRQCSSAPRRISLPPFCQLRAHAVTTEMHSEMQMFESCQLFG
jgi:hypothetical protein